MESHVNTLLRNPLRVINHIPLITDKLEIIKEWNLSEDASKCTDSPNVFANLSIIEQLKQGTISTEQALINIVSINHNGNLNKLKEDLRKIYQTGLVELHITDVCDLACLACHYMNKKIATIPFSKLEQILSNLKPKAITITGGGEPNIYSSEGKTLNEVVLEIKRILPEVSLGLINNNTHIPEGEWLQHIQWQRTSLDTSNKMTYTYLKGRDKYDAVIENVIKLLTETPIPYVGIGYLYRQENISEIFDFLMIWFSWFSKQSESVQRRFNIQFRSIAPQIEFVQIIRNGQQEFIDSEKIEIFNEQLASVNAYSKIHSDFENFLAINTNYASLFNYDKNFVHKISNFNNCYNALIHRVIRATGEEYPDFLLCNHQELSMGNTLTGDDDEIFKVALLQLWYFNKKSVFCNKESCRQGWVSNIVEANLAGQISKTGIPDNYFF